MPIYSYQCDACDEIYEEYSSINNYPQEIVCSCGEYAHIIIASAPAVVGSDTWSDTNFNPHYDAQLGQHFNSKDEKKKYLKENNLVATGDISPKKSTLGMTFCTKEQAKTIAIKDVGQSKQNKKIVSGQYTKKS